MPTSIQFVILHSPIQENRWGKPTVIIFQSIEVHYRKAQKTIIEYNKQVGCIAPVPAVEGPQDAHAELSEYATLPLSRQEEQVNPAQLPERSWSQQKEKKEKSKESWRVGELESWRVGELESWRVEDWE